MRDAQCLAQALHRRAHRPKPRIDMNRPLSRLAARAAYGASQLPRIAWYLGHGLAMTRIAQRARESGSARPRPHTDAPIPDRKRFFTDMGALWRQDLANVEAGVYPLPADHDGSLKMLLDRSRLFFEDLPAIRRRRESSSLITSSERLRPVSRISSKARRNSII
jgi:hypothetical protein